MQSSKLATYGKQALESEENLAGQNSPRGSNNIKEALNQLEEMVRFIAKDINLHK